MATEKMKCNSHVGGYRVGMGKKEGRGKLYPYGELGIASLVQKLGKRRAKQAACSVGVELASTLFLYAIFYISISIILLLLTFPAHAAAASTGRIFGQLLDGTNKNAPLAGQTVTLQMAQGNNAKDLASV